MAKTIFHHILHLDLGGQINQSLSNTEISIYIVILLYLSLSFSLCVSLFLSVSIFFSLSLYHHILLLDLGGRINHPLSNTENINLWPLAFYLFIYLSLFIFHSFSLSHSTLHKSISCICLFPIPLSTECPKINRKSLLLKYRFVLYLSRCSTDLR